MTRRTASLALVVVTAFAAPSQAQQGWVEARGPNVAVLSDAGEGRARDIAWQFEQIREALALTFPWVRSRLSRPVTVFGARNEQTMRRLLPGLFERPDGRAYSSVGVGGRDRAYVVLRADFKIDDVEGISPYQDAYWAYAAQALAETSSNLPLWVRRGLASVMSNTLVRDREIQVGRTLPDKLLVIRTQGRLGLKDLVGMTEDDPRLKRPAFLGDLDANAWAFVHFLMWGDEGARREAFTAFVSGVMNGGTPATVLTTTIGDVSQLETPFTVYFNRDVFASTSFRVSAKLSRDGFTVRSLVATEIALLRAALHVAADRPGDAKALVAETQTLDPSAGADEIVALIADRENRDDDAQASFEKAVTQKYSSWYAPYRLATLLPRTNRPSLERIETLLRQATTLNPNADDAWAFLGEVMATLDRGDTALEPVQRALQLMPSSSRHRLSLARVFLRLERTQEAVKAAGTARALARTPAERAAAQGVLAEVSKRMATPETPAATPATADPPDDPDPDPDPAVDAAPANADDTGRDGVIGNLIEGCFLDNRTCRKALPAIAGDCNDGQTDSSPAACRNAGYILDVGLGMPASATGAADYYRKGCALKDEVSCVRFATLQSQGRGVPRDAAAAVRVLDAACGKDLQEACFRLGVHLSSTKNAADLARARVVLTASCKAEFAESCTWLKKLPPQ